MSRYIDISFPLCSETVVYPGNPAFKATRVSDMQRDAPCNVTEITIGSHTGTHLDAPLHFIPGGTGVDRISLGILNGRVRVLEVVDCDVIRVEDVKSFDIEKGERIIFKTKNTKAFDCKKLLDNYVTLDYCAASYLAGKQISLIGLDYLTIEPPKSRRRSGESVHAVLLNAGIIILEGLKLSEVEAGSYELLCLPLKLVRCDGSPVRAALKII